MNASELDGRGPIVTCPKCGQRNRLVYQRLGEAFRCGKCHTELPSPNEPIEVRDDRIFDQLISKSTLPVLVDFWAPWCGPCKMMAPEITKVARDEVSHLIVAKVNTEEAPSLAAKFRINA